MDPPNDAGERPDHDKQNREETPTRAMPGDGGTTTPADAPGSAHKVQSTATDELMHRLAEAPRLDVERYAFEGEVDRGGMGAILKIHDRHLNRRLAMKVMLEREPPSDDYDRQMARQFLGRFLEEAQVTSQLDHPGVVPVHELGLDHHGKVFFTMRLIKGRTAGEVFAQAFSGNNDWTTMRALEVVLKVCDTMAFAHDKGILHRDLKPDNVMVGRFGEVYVMDWGLAKVVGQDDAHDLRIQAAEAAEPARIDSARHRDAASDLDSSVVSMDGQRLGTPSYMPPEQARSEELDHRADVYAVGAMLYELLTARAPYLKPGQREPAYRVLQQVTEGPPKPISELKKGVPAELVAIVDKAMARDKEDRYPSMLALAADLRAFVDQRAVQAYRTGALVELRLWIKRNKPLAASLAAAVLILIAGIAGTSINAREANRLATAETAAKERFASKVREFDQLSGVVSYERAVAEEQLLYPSWPNEVAAIEAWLRDVDELLAMEQSVRDTVAELEKRALPASAEEAEADRRSHPRFLEFEKQRHLVVALQREQGIRRGTAQFADIELTAAQRALDPRALNTLAWERIAPEATSRKVVGEEALGLAYARHAVEKSRDDPVAYQRLDTLAWALVANGQDAEAKLRVAEALAAASASEKDAYATYQRRIESATDGASARQATAEQQLAELAAAVSERRTWQFGTSREAEAARFLHNALTDLLGKLRSLTSNQKVQVEQRRAWAKRIGELTLLHPNARHTWPAVRSAIAANTKYAGADIELRNEDMLGLVPIGENPVTHLWEFYDLRSAWDGAQNPRSIAIPEHAADGSVAVTGTTGIVFVLLPGGKVSLGSQKDDAATPLFDPQRQKDEGLHDVTLAPFLLARHELTQGQWARLCTWDAELRDPSHYKVGAVNHIGGKITLVNPVEQVDWWMCDTLLTRYGFVLPTEAQWEYACRAGTTTPWIVAAARLKEFANVGDATAKAVAPGWDCESWHDGHVFHAPVGSFAANDFGLYDMHGNVYEWCRDQYSPHGTERPGDGLRPQRRGPSGIRVSRGGSFYSPAAYARASGRSGNAPLFRYRYQGVRAARRIAH